MEAPWKNDSEYQRMEKMEKEITAYRVQEDMISAGNGTFLFVENEGHTIRQVAKRQGI